MTEAPRPRRLLVGVAQADLFNQPRQYLVELLAGLRDLGVEVQVAMFADGPVRPELAAVADVRVMSPLAHRSPGGLLESASRRIGDGVADRVFAARTRDDRAWIRSPDCIHLHGPLAAALLRYVPDQAPVTTYVHPWDFRAPGLPPADLRRLRERTLRFLVADDAVVDELVESGIDRDRIATAPDPVSFPPTVMDRDERGALRRSLGIDDAAMVVAVQPVPDWVDCPDLTLSLAWELQRLGGENAPLIVWTGMPQSGDRRWPIDYDATRMGVTSLQLVAEEPKWLDLVGLSDVIVLPVRTSALLPDGFAEDAALRGRPVLCWEGNQVADEVDRWAGTVVRRGDLRALAEVVWSMVADRDALARARYVGWSLGTRDIEAIVPLRLPLP